jgi:hypothetical protein
MKHQNQKNSFNPILRKHLNADALFSDIYTDFSKVSDPRQGNITIPLADAIVKRCWTDKHSLVIMLYRDGSKIELLCCGINPSNR